MKLTKIMFVFAIISISYLEALMPNDSYNLNLPVSDYLKMQSVFDSVSAKIENKKFAEAEKISKKYEQQFPEMALGFFLEFYVGVESKNLSLIEKSLPQLSTKYFFVNYYYSYFQQVADKNEDKEFQLELTKLINPFCEKRIEFLEGKVADGTNLKKIYQELSYLYLLKNNRRKVYEILKNLLPLDYHFVQTFQANYLQNSEQAKQLLEDFKAKMKNWDGSNAQKIAGLMILSSTIKYYCATLPFSDIENWDDYVQSFVPKILKIRTRMEYYELLEKIVGKIGDNHTFVRFPADIESGYSTTGLEIVLIYDKYYVSAVNNKDLKSRIAVGDEIVKIDDIPVKLFIDAEKDNFPFVKYYYAKPKLAAQTALTPHLLDGKKNTKIKVEFQKPNKTKYSVSLRRNYVKKNTENSENITVKTLTDSIYYIAIRKFEGGDVYREFLSKIKDLDSTKVKGIIFDIRENRGGNSGFGDQIFSHLITSPVKNYIFNGASVYFPFEESYLGIGNVISDRPGREISPADSLIFTCPIAVLISPKTGSAAEDFAFLFKYYKRGKLIGLPTSGGTGNPYNVLLPGGGSLRICLNTDLYFFQTGIQPDVYLERSLSDLTENRDLQLEKAIEFLRKEIK